MLKLKTFVAISEIIIATETKSCPTVFLYISASPFVIDVWNALA